MSDSGWNKKMMEFLPNLLCQFFAVQKNTEDFSPVFSVKHRFLLQQDAAERRFFFPQTALQYPQINSPLQGRH